MKRVVCFIMAVAMMLSMAACTGSGNKGDEPKMNVSVDVNKMRPN